MARLLKSIVVAIVDPHRTEQLALVKAAAIAERSGARITLLNTFMMPPPPAQAASSRDVLQAAVDERMARLQKLARRLDNKGIKTQCVVEWDFPTHEAIVRYVLKAKPDLVVAESHHHNPLARMFLANTDWELIRTCPCPVWFVRSRSLPAAPKVLVAVDPKHAHAKPAKLDDRLLDAANQLVAQLGGEVSLMHVAPFQLGGSAMIMEPLHLPMPFARGKSNDETKKLVDQLAMRHAIKPANRILRTGDAATSIPYVAKKAGSHVLVMGAVSRSRVKQPFIGNTAEKVIDHVDCDVLVVKPANFKTTVKRTRVKLP
jgi:universal stress protein E